MFDLSTFKKNKGIAMLKKMFAASVAVLIVSAGLIAAEKKEFKAKCPVSGRAASESTSVEYKGGKVYMCCPGCVEPFKTDTAKFAAKANHQLVGTKQAKQVKCPFTGGKLNPETAVEVGGVKVCFCCNGCKGKVTKASADEQLQLIFSDEAFAKAFEVEAK
jgi:YHS domain-containing protein